MEISFAMVTILLFQFTNSSEVHEKSLKKKCPEFSSDDVNIYQCGAQFVQQEYVHNSDVDVSTVRIGEFPW